MVSKNVRKLLTTGKRTEFSSCDESQRPQANSRLFSAQVEKQPMKAKYRLFKRGEYFYAENATNGKQASVCIPDVSEAQRLIAAKNEAATVRKSASKPASP